MSNAMMTVDVSMVDHYHVRSVILHFLIFKVGRLHIWDLMHWHEMQYATSVEDVVV